VCLLHTALATAAHSLRTVQDTAGLKGLDTARDISTNSPASHPSSGAKHAAVVQPSTATALQSTARALCCIACAFSQP
jgi:hypothetical protein